MSSESAGGIWPGQPVVLEVNTWVWLTERSTVSGRPTHLGNLDAEDWDSLLLPGVDAVWLMGVWSRSPAGAVIARSEAGVRRELAGALPDLTDDDVVGSPYAVRAYSVDARLGGNDGLAAARRQLADRGIRLLVDYVPNHVARDHAWATNKPDYLVRATPEHLERHPTHFIRIGGSIAALGRDPYFPPWTDVVQLNAFATSLRQATVQTLTAIAAQADGVRCDMAMLLLNDVFAATWGELVGPAPATEFWPDIIREVKAVNPNFLFLAEAYWDLEPQLLEQGFDYCYDKRLYDRIVDRDAVALQAHLAADVSYQRKMVRFIENHDEPRSAAHLPADYRDTAAVTFATLPGALLLYEGQAEGRTQRPPVQLARRPVEEPDPHQQEFYAALLAWLENSHARCGRWQLLAVSPAAGDAPPDGLVAWSWRTSAARYVVVVNLDTRRRSARVALPWDDLAGQELTFSEVLSDAEYDHDGDEVTQQGLYVSLPGPGFHILSL